MLANPHKMVSETFPRLIIGVDESGVIGLTVEGFVLPGDVEIVVRDWSAGSAPDANGDLYEDTLL